MDFVMKFYICTWFLRYNICSTWFLDIRIVFPCAGWLLRAIKSLQSLKINFVLCDIWIMAPAFCTGVVASSIIFGTFFLPTSQQEKSVSFNLLAYWWQTVHIDFPSDICSPSNALDLLGSPVWGSNDIYDSHFATKVDQTLLLHSLLNSLDWRTLNVNSSMGLNCCKIPHLLHMVPLIKLWINYKYFMTAHVKPLRE